MLARLTLKTIGLLDVRVETSKNTNHRTCDVEDPLVVVDLDALCDLLPIQAWQRVTGACNALAPLCNNLQDAISQDFDNVAQLLLDLEHCQDDSVESPVPITLLHPGTHSSQTRLPSKAWCNELSSERPHRKRRRLSIMSSPLVIPSTHPSAPIIMITPAPPQPHETSCRVPLQDSAFGERLTVPLHPTFNRSHTPLVLQKQCLNSHSRTPPMQWEFVNGRRKTILPSLEEQARKGMFSRPVIVKRKSARRLQSISNI